MKYPAIYKSVEGSEYLYQNKDSYYCYERQLWDLSEPHHDCHHSDTNITAEYLANTYGEVKSKEHAEFIKLLAENHDIPCGHKVVNGDCKYFYVIDGCLFFTHREIDVVGNYKQITIPLPPEREGGQFKNIDADNIETMKFDIQDKMEKSTSTFKPIEITFNVPNGLDISFDTIEQEILGSDERNLIINVTDNRVYEYDDSSDDEWPKVGDNVRYKDAPWKVASLYKHVALLTYDDAMFEIANISDLQKPKTPEQELQEDLINIFQSSLDGGHFVDKLMAKYNITKKGEGDE